MKKNLVILFLALLPICSSAQNISTIAGSGYFAFSGDGGLATAATLCTPSGIVMDHSGNLLVTDWSNLRVRKISPAGIITTIIGNGTFGYTGDGGPATAAGLEGPWAIALDAVGNIFIADNNIIRKINTAGIITTIAGTGAFGFSGDGGPATAAEFNIPNGVAVDASGYVYVADQFNNRIRKINTSGIITTVAGNGAVGYAGSGFPATASPITYPGGMAIDTSGNIYVAVEGSGCVQEINAAGVLVTIAGNGSTGYTGDGGPATAAELVSPIAVSLDTNGNVYIADYDGFTIRKVDAAGIITTIAGNGTRGYSGDGGPATAALLSDETAIANDANGNIYFTDVNNYRIRKINALGIISTIAGSASFAYSGDGGPATTAQFINLDNIALDGSNNIYLADGFRIRKINTSGIVTTIAGNGTAGYTGDGGPATAAELNSPSSIALDASGNIYICDEGNNCIRKINTSGIITTFAGNGTPGYSGDGGPATAAEFYGPWSIALDASGDLYVADYYNNRIREINTSGIITTFAGNGTAGFAGDGGPATAAEFNGPWSVVLDASGNMFISDANNNRIRKINTAGIITTVAGNGIAGYAGDGSPATAAEISASYITVDSIDNIYMSEGLYSAIRKIDTSGIITTVTGNGICAFTGDGGLAGDAEIHTAAGIALDNSGNLLLCDTYNARLRKIDSVALAGIKSINANTMADVKIYPNPASTAVTISSTQNINSLVITNMIGQKTYAAACTGKNITINIEQFPAGVYLIMINGANAYKLIKQ